MSSRIRALFNPSSVEKRSNIAAHFCDTLYIGSRPADSETLNGLLSDVRVYNRALSAVEIAEIYSGSM
jgi:hypothetical protein